MRPYFLKVVFLISIALISCSSNKAGVKVSNESGQKVISLEIQLAGKKQTISNLKSGSAATIAFHDFGDSHYTLSGALQDGTKLTGEFGYVTNGLDFDDEFTIKEKGKIEFKSESH